MSNIGMFMHEKGSKGPTLLVKSGMVDKTKDLFEGSLTFKNTECTLNISNGIDFLGISAYIHKDGRILAKFKSKALQELLFFNHELAKSAKLLLNNSDNNNDIVRTTTTLNQAVSARGAQTRGED